MAHMFILQYAVYNGLFDRSYLLDVEEALVDNSMYTVVFYSTYYYLLIKLVGWLSEISIENDVCMWHVHLLSKWRMHLQ